MSFLLMIATIPIVISLRLVVSSVAILISLRVMVSTMTVVISFRVVISTVTTTMTGPMLVVEVMAMVAVIKNRAKCDKRNRRRNNAVIMIRANWCAGQCQGNQAANRHDSKLVRLQLFHFNLQFISTMAPM